jgi:hypothetical protein
LSAFGRLQVEGARLTGQDDFLHFRHVDRNELPQMTVHFPLALTLF